jgi:hypothetical protein
MRMMIPAEDMGEYEEPHRRRSAPERRRPTAGGLFPLNEEGEYGAPPSALPKALPSYQKRERKPKVYASYAVSSDCDVHVSKLEKIEKDRGKTPPKSIRSRRTSTSSRASVSPNRSRTTSASPDRYRQFSSPDPSIKRRSVSSENICNKNTISSRNKINTRNNNRNMSNNMNGNQSVVKTSTQSQNGFSSSKYRSSSYNQVSRDLRESSFEENEEYEYQNKSKQKSGGKISLDALREPQCDYDAMGILGLTSRMWNKTHVNQKSIISTSYMRKESVSSHVV